MPTTEHHTKCPPIFLTGNQCLHSVWMHTSCHSHKVCVRQMSKVHCCKLSLIVFAWQESTTARAVAFFVNQEHSYGSWVSEMVLGPPGKVPTKKIDYLVLLHLILYLYYKTPPGMFVPHSDCAMAPGVDRSRSKLVNFQNKTTWQKSTHSWEKHRNQGIITK